MSIPLEDIDASYKLIPLKTPLEEKPAQSKLNIAAAAFEASRAKAGPLIGDGYAEKGWKVQTYVVPCAYPRTVEGSTRKPGTKFSNDIPDPWRVDRDRANEYATHMIQEQAEQQKTRKVDDASSEQLFTFVNRYYNEKYTPETETYKYGRTLLMGIPSNFTKEAFEPYLAELLSQLGDDFIYDIWVIEFHNQGGSLYYLNYDVIGTRLAWQDFSRDILQFILRYLPGKDVPTSNETISTLHVQDPKDKNAFKKPYRRSVRGRHIFAVGHSLGGVSLTGAMVTVPELFVGGIAFDPPQGQLSGGIISGVPIIMTVTLQRKAQWTSLEASYEDQKKRPFIENWHPDVSRNYLAYSYAESFDKKSGLLLQDRYQDAMCFLEVGGYAAANLEKFFKRNHVKGTITMPKIQLIMGDINETYVEPEKVEVWAETFGITPVYMEGLPHLLIQVDPKATAHKSVEYILGAYEFYKL